MKALRRLSIQRLKEEVDFVLIVEIYLIVRIVRCVSSILERTIYAIRKRTNFRLHKLW